MQINKSKSVSFNGIKFNAGKTSKKISTVVDNFERSFLQKESKLDILEIKKHDDDGLHMGTRMNRNTGGHSASHESSEKEGLFDKIKEKLGFDHSSDISHKGATNELPLNIDDADVLSSKVGNGVELDGLEETLHKGIDDHTGLPFSGEDVDVDGDSAIDAISGVVKAIRDTLNPFS